MYNEKEIRRVIREELRSALVKYRVRRLVEQPTEEFSGEEEGEAVANDAGDVEKTNEAAATKTASVTAGVKRAE